MPKSEPLWCGMYCCLIDGFMFYGEEKINKAMAIDGKITFEQYLEIEGE